MRVMAGSPSARQPERSKVREFFDQHASWIVALLIASLGGVTSWQVSLAEVATIKRQLAKLEEKVDERAKEPPAKMAEATREALNGLAAGQERLQYDVRELRALLVRALEQRGGANR